MSSTKAARTVAKMSWLLALSLGLLAQQCLAATTVAISATASHPIPTTLYGQMFEDINHSGDGGLYAELLQNRAFQQVAPNTTAALNAWHAIGSATINVVADPMPVSSALPNALQLRVPSSASGAVGFGNEGYWGIKVDSTWTYNASFYYRFPAASAQKPTSTVSLVSSSGDTYAAASVTLDGSQTTWKQVFVTLKPNANAPNTANNFTVTLDGASARGLTVNFAMFSLFPPTYKGRANGMRIDVATALAEMNPSFFRLPGGNNLEGQSTATRWQWNATVGPLVDRPGRMGDWGYINTDGLGLMEYLYWCEDVGMQPIMAVWAGYSLDGDSLPENELAPYIQQAADQIEFVIGDTSTTYGALRASIGRAEPFNLTYIEVGNEDFFASSSYIYRWRDFYGNLSARYPQLQFIATSYPFNPILTPTPKHYDNHVYQTPHWFASNSFFYDDYERNGTTYFEGEYASISSNASDLYGSAATGRFLYPTMAASTGEAAFMTGLERNADIVFAASYAPLLQNIASTQWTPDLVSYDAATVYRSTSYYTQQLFSVNRGDEYLPSTLPDRNGTVFWSVTRRNSPSAILIKVSNTVSTPADLVFQLPLGINAGSSGTAQVLQGSQNASNTPSTPNAVTPVTSTISVGRTVNYSAPGFSVSVLTVPIA